MNESYAQSPFASPNDPDPLPTGWRIDRYVVDRLIARTSLSTVYQGRDLINGRSVAIKRLSLDARPGGLARADAMAMFRAEATILSDINHPQVLRYLGWFRKRTDCFLVTRFVDGISLRTLIARRRYTIHEARAIAKQLCDILVYLHEQQHILHADLKPENMMITHEGRVVLLDFGLARRCSTAIRMENPMGTYPYASPEQQAGGQMDFRSDQFALAVLLQELFDAVGYTTNQQVLARASAPLKRQRYHSVRQLRRHLDTRPLCTYRGYRQLPAFLWTLWVALLILVVLATLLLPLGLIFQ